ncbi:hypothetical protein LCGC14_2360530 [marine sediment metagenome]|uniref:Uncharacterized protein n=1 Tax=marine sediment metagenome TaxID=412755 RepID=A0A0F9C6Z0_9ZZZZ
MEAMVRGVDGLFLRLASDFVLSDIRWLRLSDGAQCLWLTFCYRDFVFLISSFYQMSL